MIKHEIVLKFNIYEDDNGLSSEDNALLDKAREAARSAYAPYSAFKVGAAVLLENGEIVTGNNQENMAYPSGICAERVAVFYASSKYPDVPVRTVAVTAFSADFTVDIPVTPCGSCRQVLAEAETRSKHNIRMIMQGETGKIIVAESINHLLPLTFHADKLKKSNT